MGAKGAGLIALIVAAGAIASCTLRSARPMVTVYVRADLKSETGRGGRSPELKNLSCFAVIVGRGPNPVSSAQIMDRDPSCLGLKGSFFGLFTYDQITGQDAATGKNGPPISVPLGTYDFSVVGFNGAADCSGGLSSLYSGTPVETYKVSAPTEVNLGATTNVVLGPGLYSTSSTNLTTAPGCGPATFSCSGAEACDRFTDPDNTQLTSHTMDVGTGWSTVLVGPSPIQGNAVTLIPSAPFTYALFLNDSVNRDVVVQGDFLLGDYSVGTVGLVARVVSPSNYAFATVVRNESLNLCHLNLGEILSGNSTLHDQLQIPFAECPSEQWVRLRFELVGGSYRFYYGTYVLQYGGGEPGLTVARYGALAYYSSENDYLFALDNFAVRPIARPSTPGRDERKALRR